MRSGVKNAYDPLLIYTPYLSPPTAKLGRVIGILPLVSRVWKRGGRVFLCSADEPHANTSAFHCVVWPFYWSTHGNFWSCLFGLLQPGAVPQSSLDCHDLDPCEITGELFCRMLSQWGFTECVFRVGLDDASPVGMLLKGSCSSPVAPYQVAWFWFVPLLGMFTSSLD